jgi:NADH-quinone oxidoreductase subunit E
VKLKSKTRDQILELQKKYPQKRSALIPALHLAQNENGYLPTEIQQEVAELFGLALTEVNSIVTFYDMFYDKPVGKRVVHLCKGLSCMLNGSDPLAEKLCERLNIAPGQMTADGKITVHLSECLGACDRAPMAIIDHEVAGPLTSESLDEILAKGDHTHG